MGTEPGIPAVVLSNTILGRNRPRGVVIALCIAFTIGCAARVKPPERPAHLLEYHVAPPDVLTISVRPAPEIVRQLVIRPDGRISFDLIGDLEVQGKTVDQIRREITARLEEFIVHPDVTVVLSASNSRKYFVFGAVGRPGSYPLIGDVTALGALFGAGGPTRRHRLARTRLLRPGRASRTGFRRGGGLRAGGDQSRPRAAARRSRRRPRAASSHRGPNPLLLI